MFSFAPRWVDLSDNAGAQPIPAPGGEVLDAGDNRTDYGDTRWSDPCDPGNAEAWASCVRVGHRGRAALAGGRRRPMGLLRVRKAGARIGRASLRRGFRADG
jgi:hypothetical protein